jgi:hypothetical protein
MFSATNQPANNGRPKGSRNKRGQFSKELAEQALEQLTLAVNQGEPWAIQEVLKRISPTLKPITPEESLDGDMLALKIKEVSEFEERLSNLEAKTSES